MRAMLSIIKNYSPAQLTANAYFLLLSGANFIGTLIATGLHWINALFLLICLLPVVVNRRMVYIICGWITSLLFGYLLLAVTDDFLDYLRGEDHYTQPWKFSIGYLFTLSGILCSVIYIAIGGVKKNHAVGDSTAL